MSRKCFKCQKGITAGKFYSFYIGKKGSKSLGAYKGNAYFCSPCAEKEEEENESLSGMLIKIEWEIGNRKDEEVIEFEEKWQDHLDNIARRMPGGRIGEASFNLDFIKKVRQELEPYLEKPEIVEKSFGGKIEGCGVAELGICYSFSKSARDEKYRQEVVKPTFVKILGGGDPSQEINVISSSVTNPSDAQGSTRGIWKINEKVDIPYCWNDNEGGDCRYVSFVFRDHKIALQSLCRALKIKEKELKGEPEIPQNPPIPPRKEDKENSPSKNPSHQILIVSLAIGGVIILVGVIVYFRKRKN